MIRLKRVKNYSGLCFGCYNTHKPNNCHKVKCNGRYIFKRVYTLDDIIGIIEKKYGKKFLLEYLQQREEKNINTKVSKQTQADFENRDYQ